MSKVIVVGSINMDIVATVDRFPEKGETMRGSSLEFIQGGKGANQAVAAKRFGAKVVLIGAAGKDSFGDNLIAFYEKEGIQTQSIKRVEGSTGVALIEVNKTGDNKIVVIEGGNSNVSWPSSGLEVDKDDVLLTQLEVPTAVVKKALHDAKRVGAITVLNPSPMHEEIRELLENVDFLVLNEVELNQLEDSVEQLQQQFSFRGIVLTQGADNVMLYSDDGVKKFDVPRVNAVDTTGAGDCFTGVFAAQLSQGREVKEAIEMAIQAAAYSVQKKGASPSMPRLSEL